jgi:putative methyltransferase
MSLYYEAADVLTAPANAGGSLKSRIFGNKNVKSQPAQIYALVIETCKWSSILKEVIERAALLSSERKVFRVATPLWNLD